MGLRVGEYARLFPIVQALFVWMAACFMRGDMG